MRTKEEIFELIKHVKGMGLESVEVDGMVFKIGNKCVPAPLPFVPEMRSEEIVKPMSVLDEYTEEEVLYWATPFFDELQTRKNKSSEMKSMDDELRGIQ